MSIVVGQDVQFWHSRIVGGHLDLGPETLTVHHIDDEYVLLVDREGRPRACTREQFDSAILGPPRPPQEWFVTAHLTDRGWIACLETEPSEPTPRHGTWIGKAVLIEMTHHCPKDSHS